jgi:hypothetical protein
MPGLRARVPGWRCLTSGPRSDRCCTGAMGTDELQGHRVRGQWVSSTGSASAPGGMEETGVTRARGTICDSFRALRALESRKVASIGCAHSEPGLPGQVQSRSECRIGHSFPPAAGLILPSALGRLAQALGTVRVPPSQWLRTTVAWSEQGKALAGEPSPACPVAPTAFGRRRQHWGGMGEMGVRRSAAQGAVEREGNTGPTTCRMDFAPALPDAPNVIVIIQDFAYTWRGCTRRTRHWERHLPAPPLFRQVR